MDIPYSEKELISRTSFNRFDEQIILRSQEEREKEKKILENIIYTFVTFLKVNLEIVESF